MASGGRGDHNGGGAAWAHIPVASALRSAVTSNYIRSPSWVVEGGRWKTCSLLTALWGLLAWMEVAGDIPSHGIRRTAFSCRRHWGYAHLWMHQNFSSPNAMQLPFSDLRAMSCTVLSLGGRNKVETSVFSITLILLPSLISLVLLSHSHLIPFLPSFPGVHSTG